MDQERVRVGGSMKACMFPGQGAQRIGMGEGLFSRFQEEVSQADDILGYSITALVQDGPMEKLSQTEYTQPALYVVNSLKYLSYLAEGETPPDILLGHSVSEYVALFASGVLDFAAGLRLVAKRGALMAEARGGGMAAVLGLEAAAIEELLKEKAIADIFPANFNTPKQTVLSGRRETIVEAEQMFLEAGASHYKVLPVSGAFHTPFMNEARDRFAEFAADVPFGTQQVPVISNVTARPHVDGRIRERMIEQITSPVRWSESLRYLMARGVAFSDTVELGPDGPPVVRPMFKRTELEADPLDAAEHAAEEAVTEGDEPATTDAPAASPERPARMNGAASNFGRFSMEKLGSRPFCDRFGARYPYVSGAMYQGIASADLVIRMARSGLLGFRSGRSADCRDQGGDCQNQGGHPAGSAVWRQFHCPCEPPLSGRRIDRRSPGRRRDGRRGFGFHGSHTRAGALPGEGLEKGKRRGAGLEPDHREDFPPGCRGAVPGAGAGAGRRIAARLRRNHRRGGRPLARSADGRCDLRGIGFRRPHRPGHALRAHSSGPRFARRGGSAICLVRTDFRRSGRRYRHGGGRRGRPGAGSGLHRHRIDQPVHGGSRHQRCRQGSPGRHQCLRHRLCAIRRDVRAWIKGPGAEEGRLFPGPRREARRPLSPA
ncbi:ACP S-malonyltransferase [Roseibium salinum]|uniref:ACP S-malonyltransferase n=1 Tax=Roseibium salinum TaxID=1604349 RepID=UPI003619D0E8